MNRTSLMALSGIALAVWLVVFGGARPNPLFIVVSTIMVSLALLVGSVISGQLGKNSPVPIPRKVRLFQWLIMLAWLSMAYWILLAIAKAFQ